MNNIAKVKIIIELLDQTKYPVLGTLSQNQLDQLESEDIGDVVDALREDELQGMVTEFIEAVNNVVVEATDDDASSDLDQDEGIDSEQPSIISMDLPDNDGIDLDRVANILNEQPSSVVACIMSRFDAADKAHVHDKLSATLQRDVAEIRIEDMPIAGQVMDVMIEELQLQV